MSSDPFAVMAASLTPKRAVSYLRVSTREQAARAGGCQMVCVKGVGMI